MQLGGNMAQSVASSMSSVARDRPLCSRCGKQMSLTRVVPVDPHEDQRTFECPICAIAEKVIVKHSWGRSMGAHNG